MNREAYSVGLKMLSDLQRELEYPPKRKLIPDFVHKIVKNSGLRGDTRERYFTLLAYCALKGLEPMYNSYKPRRKHGKESGKDVVSAERKESELRKGVRNKESKETINHEISGGSSRGEKKNYKAKKDKHKGRHRHSHSHHK